MSIETALIAGGIELIKFIISKVWFAEQDPKLDTGPKKHKYVKDEICNKFDNTCIHQHADEIIKANVEVFNDNNIWKIEE